MSVNRVNRFVTSDGTTFFNEYDAKKYDSGFDYECPKCLGLGIVKGPPIYGEVPDPENDFGGFHSSPLMKKVVISHEKQDCDICNGLGFTKKLMKSVEQVKTEVIGYK